MAYKVGSTTVIDDSGNIDWSRIANAPTLYSDQSARAAQAGHAIYGIGSYLFALGPDSGTYAPGGTIAGSLIDPALIRYDERGYDMGRVDKYAATPAGTWRCMGYAVGGSYRDDGDNYDYAGATLWLRIA